MAIASAPAPQKALEPLREPDMMAMAEADTRQVESEPISTAAEDRPQGTPEDDHEIAASAAQAQSVEAAHQEPPTEARRIEPQPAETRRHAIHGAPEEPTTTEPAPRKMGWWSRRKTG
jgi:hypothetical protein